MNEVSGAKPFYEIFYKTNNKIDCIIKKSGQDQKPFLPSHIWVNDQPAKCLKKFNFNRLWDWDSSKEINDHLFIYHYPSSEEITVHVQDMKEHPLFTLLISPCLTGHGLRLIIERKKQGQFELKDKFGAPVSASESLKTYNVQDQDVFFLEEITPIEIIRNGQTPDGEELQFGYIPPSFVNFKDQKEVTIDQKTFDWRTISRGLNLEGTCINNKCPSVLSKTKVCIPINRHGTFPISDIILNCKCTACPEKIPDTEIKNCIFWDCIFTIEGSKQENQEPFKLGPQQAPRDRAISFAENNQVVQWEDLIIITQAVPTKVPAIGCQLF